ncbi:MAG: cation diffusion facilitator family transporter [Candidatus Dormibacteraceae bacterium]
MVGPHGSHGSPGPRRSDRPSHDHAHGPEVYQSRDATRAVIVSATVLAIASAAEFAAAFAGHSAGILADALHNAGDVLTTGILLGSFALARRPATRRFTSGYGRIEDVATLLIVLVIVGTAALAAVESALRLFNPTAYPNVAWSLIAAAIGIVANLGAAQYKIGTGRRILSTALEADGVHSRIDSLVSLGALIGIAVAHFTFPPADPIAGLAITAAILYVLAGTVRELFLRMMDAVDPSLVDELTAAAGEVPGVLGVHDVRVRWVGRELMAVVHIDCEPDSSLRAAHDLALKVEHEVEHHVPAVRVDIHMDPGTTPHQH